MELLSHESPELEPFKESISKHIKSFETMNIPYWILVDNKKPEGILAIGPEPLQLLRPVGTTVGLVGIISRPANPGHCGKLAAFAVRKAKETNAEYIFGEISSSNEECIRRFEEADYQTVAISHRMEHSLEGDMEKPERLRFKRVSKEGVPAFLEKMQICMADSPDLILEMTLPNLVNLPAQMLDAWYMQQELYLALKDDEKIGILNLCPATKTNIANMGVTPDWRGQGFGKEILSFALLRLKEANCRRARLRVHSENEPAIGLYESMDFEQAGQYHALMWEP